MAQPEGWRALGSGWLGGLWLHVDAGRQRAESPAR